MEKPALYLLAVIIAISFFFRFYNFQKLQYWSSDEEIASSVVRRMIVEKKPTLVSPNLAVGSLGSFFHIASIPIFLLAGFDPVKILLLSGLLGLATTLIIFFIGKEIGNLKIGLVSSFLYASSFAGGLFDRRWWPLSLNLFLTSFAILCLIQIIYKKKYFYMLPLSAVVGLAAHADPTIGVIGVAAIISFIFFKVSVFRKELLFAVLILLVFLAPVLVFELRHPGKISGPLLNTTNKIINEEKSKTNKAILTSNPLISTSRLFFPKAADFAERHFCYCKLPKDLVLFYPFSGFLIIGLISLPLLKLRSKNKKKESEKILIKICYIFLFSFFLGGLSFYMLYGQSILDHYYSIIFPAIFVLSAFTIAEILKRDSLVYLTLFIIFSINFYSLVNSSFKYPLYQKYQVVKDISRNLGSRDFSFYTVGDISLHGGGLTALFVLNNHHPKKSYIYPFYDWMYQAFSLYSTKPTTTDQERIVLIGSAENFPQVSEDVIFTTESKSLKGQILDNSKLTFDEKEVNWR